MAVENVDTALLTIRRGQAAQSALQIGEQSLEDLNKSVDDRIFAKLLRNEVLSPEEALQAWLEKYAYHRLAKKLRQTVRSGQRAAAEVGEEFDLTRSSSV